MGNINTGSYVTIQAWMRNDLHLKGNELLVYAIIFGLSQKENQWFEGSRQYLADWTGATKQGIDKNLKSLLEKGLIEKRDNIINGVKFVCYRATEFTEVVNKVAGGSKQSLYMGQTEFTGGSKQSLHNNIDIQNINNSSKYNSVYTREATELKTQKHKYGEYNNVLLTDDEYLKLQELFPDLSERIERLSEYVASSGKAYKSHYATIRAWSRKEKPKQTVNSYKSQQFSADEQRIATWAERRHTSDRC